jgi:hypothetical protein
MDAPSNDLDFRCPRCDRAATGRFYGPCPDCAAALAEAYPGLARDVVAPEYEPKMNVVPNQIATKE